MDESLENIDQYIALVTKRIEEQRNRVLEQRRCGEDDTSSQRLLAALIHSLTLCEQRREHLVEKLADRSPRDPNDKLLLTSITGLGLPTGVGG